jgi:hypothetical protein
MSNKKYWITVIILFLIIIILGRGFYLAILGVSQLYSRLYRCNQDYNEKREETNSLIKNVIEKEGCYVSPSLFEQGTYQFIDLYIQNKFNITKEFNLEILPDMSIDPVIPYNKIHLKYDRSHSIGPNQFEGIPIFISIDENQFTKSSKSNISRYILKIKENDKDYATTTFSVSSQIRSQNEFDFNNLLDDLIITCLFKSHCGPT